MKKVALIFFICLVLMNICYAKTVVHLKSGAVGEGELVERTEEYIKLDYCGVELIYWMDEIESINAGQENESAQVAAPCDVYVAYLVALDKGNWRKIKKYVTKENIKQLEETGDTDKVLKMMMSFKAKNMKIIDERVKADEAVLTATGTIFNGASKGVIHLRKEDGQWKVSKEEWKAEGVEGD